MAENQRPLHYLSLAELSRKLRSGGLSPLEATEALLARIGALDPQLRSFCAVSAEHALAQAGRMGEEMRRGHWRGPLHGVPVAVKDLCDTAFAATSAGMPFMRDRVPQTSATVVRRLEAAGAVILGKLSMTEGAGLQHHPEMPTPRNPWHGDYWPGVSSSGSGVATAAGLCFASLGSDTGGSIRFPSASCGLTGLKPTWGRVSRRGVFPLAESYDHIGPIARTAEDCAIVFEAIAGRDPLDPTTLADPVESPVAGLGGSVRGSRIGFDAAFSLDGVEEEVARAVTETRDVLADLGAEIVPVEVPLQGYSEETFMVTMRAENALAHAPFFDRHRARYGAALANMIEAGRRITGPQAAKANLERIALTARFNGMFGRLDALLLPAIPFTVPALAQIPARIEDIPSSSVANLMRYTKIFNATGLPTITFQAGQARNGLPIGVQLAGPRLGEAPLLRLAHAYQRATDWHTRHPDIDGGA